MSINLAAFSGPTAYDTGTPWLEGEWMYATDGHIVVRVPAPPDATPPSPERRIIPNAPLLFCPPAWPDWPVLVLPTAQGSWPKLTVRCGWCQGTGRGDPCRQCKGSRVATCSACGQDRECPECAGQGLTIWYGAPRSCAICKGTGRRVTQHALTEVDGLILYTRHAEAILALPGIHIHPRALLGPQVERMVFIFNGGGQGVVATHRRPEGPGTEEGGT